MPVYYYISTNAILHYTCLLLGISCNLLTIKEGNNQFLLLAQLYCSASHAILFLGYAITQGWKEP
ncbi:uncharacterized protein EV154DRAFT_515656 [Mucor mucedo]|uniref:uncharacterized protein n=1 Tax=Mucor mucedo TaxID=29922 RepID=UPI00221E7E5D|nr:uncharacterized protein EV154DRAFT_515656 [Mucor mucedo]KAI7889041.1 hypothetical protein EV154DRAFT_515656 [Mucor mucedo]